MQIKLIVSAAAIALVAGLGSAAAEEDFTTLDGLSAQTYSDEEGFTTLAGMAAQELSAAELGEVRGANGAIFVHHLGDFELAPSSGRAHDGMLNAAVNSFVIHHHI